MTTKDVIALADKTSDAYSFHTYGRTEWRRAIRALAAMTFSAREIEAILRSKWTRWAADSVAPRKPLGLDLLAWMGHNLVNRQAEVRKLVVETFPSCADLAGACKSEDIVELIDLARMVKNGVTGPRFQQIASDILVRIERRAK